MPKEIKYYFSHDIDAHRDSKILELRADLGWEGYGLFWALIESLRAESDCVYPLRRLKALAMSLNTHLNILMDIITKYELFDYDKNGNDIDFEHGNFWSNSLKRRKEYYDELSETRRNAANKRWKNKTVNDNDEKTYDQSLDKEELTDYEQECKSNANEMQKQCNKIKENKIKENLEEKEKNTLTSIPKEKEKLAEEKFDAFRKIFPGTRKSLAKEFANFKKKYPKEYLNIVDELMPALEREKEYADDYLRSYKKAYFWKHLQTWINNACWEHEFTKIKDGIFRTSDMDYSKPQFF